jgi:hypothetical protein
MMALAQPAKSNKQPSCLQTSPSFGLFSIGRFIVSICQSTRFHDKLTGTNSDLTKSSTFVFQELLGVMLL